MSRMDDHDILTRTARERALGLRGAAASTLPAPSASLARLVAIGDPQSSAERWFGALAAHGLLGDDGWLRRDVGLVAMGDYFDYQVSEREQARVDGVLILGWLAAHAPEQVTLLFGNHDAARVMELAFIDDQRFRAAADAAEELVRLPREQRGPGEAEFARRFPELATPGYAARDYNAFTIEQRVLVQRLLLAGRFALAATAAVHGMPMLLTHAGVTRRELDMLSLRHTDAQTIAGALNARLAAAVRHVAAAWRAGTKAELSLAPLHVAGAAGEEGGGLLYHRPADPERPDPRPPAGDARTGRRPGPAAGLIQSDVCRWRGPVSQQRLCRCCQGG